VRYANDVSDLNFTEFTNGGHGIWGPVFNMPEMYDWMFSHSRSDSRAVDPVTNGQIIVNNITAFLPVADPTGEAIRAGTGFMAIGSIGMSDAAVTQTNAASLATLASSFSQFGASLPVGVNSVEGLFAANIGAPLGGNHPLLGKNIYLIVGDGRDIESSDSLFVFKSDQIFTTGSAGAAATIALSNGIDAGKILLGKRGTVFANRLGGFRAGIIAAAVNVPEPRSIIGASVVLVAASIGFQGARGRRRAGGGRKILPVVVWAPSLNEWPERKTS
jgi:hypothetical protein